MRLFQESGLGSQFPILAFELGQAGAFGEGQLALGATAVGVTVFAQPPPQTVLADSVGLGDFGDRLRGVDDLTAQLILELGAERST